MKKSKLMILCLGVVLALCAGLTFSFGTNKTSGQLSSNNVNIACRTKEPTNSQTATSQTTENVLPEDMGKIPFSIYTAESNFGVYSIVDYLPTFTKTTNQTNTSIYEINDNAVPYILLSSSYVGTLDSFYNTSLFFRFNDHNFNKDSSYGMIADTNINVKAKIKTFSTLEEIELETNIDDSSSRDDAEIYFSVNLIRTDGIDSDKAICPEVSSPINTGASNPLGGGTNVSYRTGLYTFEITYAYTTATTASLTSCKFIIKFYVLDYASYAKIDDTSSTVSYEPLDFENADKFEYEGFDTGYYIYNYNYENVPVISYNPTLFNMNFAFTVPTTKNVFYFLSRFEYGQTDDLGYVTFTNESLTNSYVLTATKDDSTFVVEFDLNDFQEFIFENSNILGTSSFQGTYAFNVDLLTRSLDENEGSFAIVNKETFNQNILDTLDKNKLVIFGYELKYNDKSQNRYMPLVNDKTRTTFIAKNNASNSYNITIPEIIAQTNRAPLRFDSYGNLNGYKASFYKLNNSSVTGDMLINNTDTTAGKEVYFGAIQEDRSEENINALKRKISGQSNTYNQGLSISGDGIYIMLLEYKIMVPVTKADNTIVFPEVTGEQIIAFQINNMAQTVFPHALTSSGENKIIYTFNRYTKDAVRIGAIDSKDAFFAPMSVEYSYYAGYSTSGSAVHGTLTKKENDTYQIDGVNYSYYVTSPDFDHTFSSPGTYIVTLRNLLNNSSSTTIFTIDNSSFEDISIYNVAEGANQGYYKISSSKTLLTDGINITSSPFTLSWKEKESALYAANKYSSYICFMPINENDTTTSLFKNGSDLWLTNGYSLGDAQLDIEKNYQNSYSISGELGSKMYFKKDGLYMFYISDLAGNYFTKFVLLDSTSPSSLQGYWDKTISPNVWIEDNSFYINKQETFYFGTHKALAMANLDIAKEIHLVDNSIVSAYKLSDGSETSIGEIELFEGTNDLYDYLKSFSNQIVKQQNSALIGNAPSSYYFLVKNNSLDYSVFSVETGEETKAGKLTSDFAKIDIYTTKTNNSLFYGENQYAFTLNNGNGTSIDTIVEMNFDLILFSFYGYDSNNNEYSLSKNQGTNLNSIGLKYLDVKTTYSYYEVTELKYQYYEFSYSDQESASYPFSSSYKEEDLLNLVKKIGDKYVANSLNTDAYGRTLPGKYVITRTYKGGNYERVTSQPESGSYIKYGGSYFVKTPSGTGGSYWVQNDTVEVSVSSSGNFNKQNLEPESGDYIKIGSDYYVLAPNNDGNYLIRNYRNPENIFTYDTLKRTYTLYVDRYSIVSSSDGIGGCVNMQLSGDSEWLFKDFYKLYAENFDLTTNKVPVTLNVPISKYFVKTNNGYVYAKESFAKLNAEITFIPENGSTIIYKTDMIDSVSGMLVCSALVSSSNPRGYLTFDKAGTYIVKIYDNTGYRTLINKKYQSNINPNTLEFSFVITHSSPTLDAYTQVFSGSGESPKTTKLEEYTTNSYATNIKNADGNNIYLTFADPQYPYIAKVSKVVIEKGGDREEIDLTSITDIGDIANPYSLFISHFYRDYYSSSTAQVYDGENYYRYKYKIQLKLDSEGEYIVTLYCGDSAVYSFNKNAYSIAIDRTKPNTNISKLLSGENFLISSNYYSSSNLNNFLDENFDINDIRTAPSIFTYAFGVDSSFALEYNKNDTLEYFYIRKYNKYSSDNSFDMNQSVTPDMVLSVQNANHAYYTSDALSDYPKFSELTLENDMIVQDGCQWFKVNYASTPLYNIIRNVYGSVPSGYYEIIEKDGAGNYRAFTLFYSSEDISNLISYSGLTTGNSIVSSSAKDITLDEFALTSLSSSAGWATITISAKGTRKIYAITPYNRSLAQEQIDSINEEFFEGAIDLAFDISLLDYNSAFRDITKRINVASKNADITKGFKVRYNSDGTYSLSMPQTKTSSAIYLTYFNLQIWNNGAFTSYNNIEYSTQNAFESNTYITGLPQGRYRIIYKDNIHGDQELKYTLSLVRDMFEEQDFDRQYFFSSGKYIYDAQTDIYYTGGDFSVVYESDLYNVVVTKNSQNISISESEYTKEAFNAKTFSLSSDFSNEVVASLASGGTTSYVIYYYDSIDTSVLVKSIKIVIFDLLPEINLTTVDSLNVVPSSYNESSSLSSNVQVKIDWGNLAGPVESLSDDGNKNDQSTSQVTKASLYKKNTKGEYVYSIATVFRENNNIISSEGTYKLVLSNKVLGNTRCVYFKIQLGKIVLYSVSAENKELESSKIETLDLSSNDVTARENTQGQSEQIMSLIYKKLRQMKENGLYNLNDIAYSSTTNFEALLSQMGYRTNANGEMVFNKANIGIANITNLKHFYTIYDYEVTLNTIINPTLIEIRFEEDVLSSSNIPSIVEKYYTTIYILYTFSGPIKVELFAVTKVPKTQNVLDNFFSCNGVLMTSNDGLQKIVTGSGSNEKVTLSWKTITNNKKWYNAGNYIYVVDTFGQNDYSSVLDFTFNGSNSSSIISTSGKHKLTFADLSGNTHLFSQGYNQSKVFTLSVINNVIYYIEYANKNGDSITSNPIPYGVFNDKLTIVLDSDYLGSYYNVSLTQSPTITALKNGTSYSLSFDANSTNRITFTESGKYEVSLSATLKDGTKIGVTKFVFTLLATSSKRLAFEYVEVNGYEITKVLKNDVDITSNFADSKGKVKSIFISSSSSLSGNGEYSITLKYGEHQDNEGNVIADTLFFTFTINDYTPMIMCSIEKGSSTTDDISITYDPGTIYQEVGSFRVNILVYNSDGGLTRAGSYVYNSSNIPGENGVHAPGNKSEIKIVTIGTYIVQLETENGNVLTSFRIDKTEPLNFFSIIIIIATVVGVAVLLFVIFRLRTKMKIR